ncbi:MAG: tetratricopeptide repeat protein [Planctomycetes bacterium]|nr:tetratricopeptide repeat protein [Planctomycetota bacterium]
MPVGPAGLFPRSSALTPERRFVASVLGHLRRCDPDALRDELDAGWSNELLVAFLRGDDDDTAKVAAACLGVVGTLEHSAALAGALHHDDAVMVTMAEHALWQIWFRSARPPACIKVAQAAHLIALQRFTEARHLLDEAIGLAPDFAEAYNQRAIVYFLTDRFLESMADCKRVLRSNRWHFAARAGLGHCFAQLGQYTRALGHYQAALRIHPRMDGIRQSIQQIRRTVKTAALVPLPKTCR